MVLSDTDRRLLMRCLAHEPRSWESFVDRYLGLVLHVVNHSARSRSLRVSEQDREDLVADVFVEIVNDDYAVLRRFRGESSLATYLTVIARRVVVRELCRKHSAAVTLSESGSNAVPAPKSFEQRISDREEVDRLLASLNGAEAEIVRLYHLEGKSYQEISAAIGIPENSVGPTLSRARMKMRATATS